MWMLLHLMALLNTLYLFSFFIFLFPIQLDCFPLLHSPCHWSILPLSTVHYLFHLVCFYFKVLRSSPLKCSFVFFYFVMGITEVLHFFLQSSESLNDHYFKFSMMHITSFCLALLRFLSFFFIWDVFICLLTFSNSLCLFLCFRKVSYISCSWE